MNLLKNTQENYSFLWHRQPVDTNNLRSHYLAMRAVIDEPIVRGKIGIEVGTGCGNDLLFMAKENPRTKFVSIDISDGVYKARELTRGLGNVLIIKSSALELPIEDESLDFAYSFGVLHHTINPKKGLLEIARVLKKESRAYIYLYEDHSGNILKYLGLKIVTLLRALTIRMPPVFLNALSWLASPFIYMIFSLPARALNSFKFTRSISEQMPFNFGTGPFSLRWDIYDRFSAPIEYRFSDKELRKIFQECGFSGVKITRLIRTAGWVAWGCKS